MVAYWYLINKPRKEVDKNNPYVVLTSLKIRRVPIAKLYFLLDKKLSKALDKTLLEHKDVLTDALAVFKLTEKIGNNQLTYNEYLFNIAKDIELVTHGKVDPTHLAKKIINLQLKKGYYVLRGDRLLLSKKGKRMMNYLLPFLIVLVDD